MSSHCSTDTPNGSTAAAMTSGGTARATAASRLDDGNDVRFVNLTLSFLGATVARTRDVRVEPLEPPRAARAQVARGDRHLMTMASARWRCAE